MASLKIKSVIKMLMMVSAISGGFLLTTKNASAVSTVNITSPANGQEYSGNNFSITGTTDPNTTVFVKKGTTVLKQVISDGSGNWTANLSGLPDGQNTLSATAVKATGFAYFTSTPDSFGTIKINQLRFADNAINPSAPFPLTPTNTYVALAPSQASDIFYGFPSLLSANTVPGKFNATAPADPASVVSGIGGAYPANAAANKLSFTLDGSKAYIPNLNLTNISVVDVASNSLIKNIELGGTPGGATTGPNGKIYVSLENAMAVIDPSDDSLTTQNTTCTSLTTIFSEDVSYPYYYGMCGDGKILQLKMSDNSEANVWNIGYQPTGGYLNPENSKLFIYNGALGGATDSNKVLVVATSTGNVDKVITMSGGAAGFINSPDAQRLYVGIPNNDLSGNAIDIVDLKTESVVDTLTILDTPIAITFSNYSTQETAVKNVSVVLGVKTAAKGGGSLANTGAIAISASILAGVLLGSAAYIYYDFRKHRKPLVMEDPTVRYTLSHHMKVVTLPLLRYRLRLTFVKSSDGPIQRF